MTNLKPVMLSEVNTVSSKLRPSLHRPFTLPFQLPVLSFGLLEPAVSLPFSQVTSTCVRPGQLSDFNSSLVISVSVALCWLVLCRFQLTTIEPMAFVPLTFFSRIKDPAVSSLVTMFNIMWQQ